MPFRNYTPLVLFFVKEVPYGLTQLIGALDIPDSNPAVSHLMVVLARNVGWTFQTLAVNSLSVLSARAKGCPTLCSNRFMGPVSGASMKLLGSFGSWTGRTSVSSAARAVRKVTCVPLDCLPHWCIVSISRA